LASERITRTPWDFRQLQQFSHAAVLAALGDHDLFDVVGGMAQLGGDGVEAVDQARLTHGRPP
jgi:hypothetical protein